MQDDCGDLYDKDTVTHRYTRLSSQARQVNLDSILSWSEKFPFLEHHYNTKGFDCDIIHMDVALDLMEIHAQDGADLVTRSEVSVTAQGNESCEWQTVTSLIMPPELCRDFSAEQYLGANVTPAMILSSDSNEIRLKVRFPAEEWAHIFTCLTDIKLKHDENKAYIVFDNDPFERESPSSDYLQRISMYQEIQSCSGRGMPLICRAIILWTFRMVIPGEKAETTWRYIDNPSQSCVSPSSQSSHHTTVSPITQFNAWTNSPPEVENGTLGAYVRPLVSPLTTTGLESTFEPESFDFQGQQFSIHPESLSLESIASSNSEPLSGNANIIQNDGDYFASAIDTRPSPFAEALFCWNGIPSGSPHQETAWASCAAIPTNTLSIDCEPISMSQPWHINIGPRITHWSELKDGRSNWSDLDASAHQAIYLEEKDHNLESWINAGNGEVKDELIGEADDAQLPILPPGPVDTKDSGWAESETGFDFNQLIERLRA